MLRMLGKSYLSKSKSNMMCACRPYNMISDYRRALVPKYVHNTRKPKYFLHANLYISNIQLFLMIRSF